MRADISKRILISITGKTENDWKKKFIEVEKFRLKRIALFLEFYSKNEKLKIYKTLLNSNIKEIPLVHARNDMTKEEFKFLEKKFKTKCFTIHEDSFKYLDKWEGFHKKLFVEFNYDNYVPFITQVRKIGGFCIDLSHFKASKERHTKDDEYILSKKKIHKYFKCNHLNGYSPYRKRDLHTIRTLKDFDYLKTLPKFIFGKYIAIETFNKIEEQLKFKKYLCKILKSKI